MLHKKSHCGFLLLRKVRVSLELAAFTLANSHYHVLDSSATFGHSSAKKKLSDLLEKRFLIRHKGR